MSAPPPQFMGTTRISRQNDACAAQVCGLEQRAVACLCLGAAAQPVSEPLVHAELRVHQINHPAHLGNVAENDKTHLRIDARLFFSRSSFAFSRRAMFASRVRSPRRLEARSDFARR